MPPSGFAMARISPTACALTTALGSRPMASRTMRAAMRSTPSSECLRFSRCSALVHIGPGLANLFGALMVLATSASMSRILAYACAVVHSGGSSRPTHGPSAWRADRVGAFGKRALKSSSLPGSVTGGSLAAAARAALFACPAPAKASILAASFLSRSSSAICSSLLFSLAERRVASSHKVSHCSAWKLRIRRLTATICDSPGERVELSTRASTRLSFIQASSRGAGSPASIAGSASSTSEITWMTRSAYLALHCFGTSTRVSPCSLRVSAHVRVAHQAGPWTTVASSTVLGMRLIGSVGPMSSWATRKVSILARWSGDRGSGWTKVSSGWNPPWTHST